MILYTSRRYIDKVHDRKKVPKIQFPVLPWYCMYDT